MNRQQLIQQIERPGRNPRTVQPVIVWARTIVWSRLRTDLLAQLNLVDPADINSGEFSSFIQTQQERFIDSTQKNKYSVSISKNQ